MPTAEADIQIAPAEGADAKEGESDVLVKWRQGIPWRLLLTADNSGTRATGRYQTGVTLAGDHLLALNDLFYINYNQGLGNGPDTVRGTRGATIHYSIPFDYWLLSATVSNGAYHQTIIGPSQNYVYRGRSETGEVKLSRLFQRNAVSKSTAWGRVWTRASNRRSQTVAAVSAQRRQ